VVVQRMAETGLTRFPVVDRDPPNRLLGIISLDDLLKARALNLEAERRRERIMRMEDLVFPFKFRRARETV
jgi:CBS domain-containing protein